jgi:aspartate aminotransferase
MARVRPSATSAVVALAAELKAQGRDLISLGAGEPDFPTPEHVREAAIAAIRAGDTRYTPVAGTRALKEAISRKFARENGLRYGLDQILVSVGAKHTLFNACQAMLDPGDEAIVPAPYWVSYPDMVRLAGAEPVIIDTGIDNGFKISPAALDAAISERTRILFLNSPSNPTGACYTRAELAALGEVLLEHPDVLVLADDIYEHVYWGDEPFASFAQAVPAMYERTLTINGVSKAYAMTGWRIGYAGGPRKLIAAMTTIQTQVTSNPCSISQAAAIAALDGDQSCVREMAAAYQARHEYVVEALNALPGFECRPGQGAFYAFPRVEGAIERLGLADDAALVEHFLKEADVAMVPGSAFGAPGYVRISFACSMEELEEAVRRIGKALK